VFSGVGGVGGVGGGWGVGGGLVGGWAWFELPKTPLGTRIRVSHSVYIAIRVRVDKFCPSEKQTR